jgi:replicative DNA helicase
VGAYENVDLEILAVSSIIVNEEVGEYAAKLQSKWLSHEPARRAWSVATSYYQAHRECVPKELVRAEVPSFKFKSGSGSVDGVLESLQTRHLRSKVEDIYEDEVTCMEDPIESLPVLISNLTALQAGIQRGEASDLSETIDDSIDRYKYRRDNKGSLGLPWYWEPLQRETNGAQLGEYVVIYARPKQQKTFVLLKSVQHWVKYCHRRAVIITREMTKDQLQDRMICLWAEVDHAQFRKGSLTDPELRKLEKAAAEIKTSGKMIIETVETYGAEAAAEVSALCDQYGLEEGDILCVDGLDWFAYESDYKSLRAFSQGLKKIAVGGKISGKKRSLVVIATGQANQNLKRDQHADAGKEMSGGDGPIRDCDIALKLQLNKEDSEIQVDISAIREGDSIRFTINAIPCTDYSVKFSDSPDEDSKTPTIPAPVVRTTTKKKGKKGAPKDIRSPEPGPGKSKPEDVRRKGKSKPGKRGLDPSKVKFGGKDG